MNKESPHHIKEELESIGCRFHRDHPDKSDFFVPEEYFEALPQTIQEKITSRSIKRWRLLPKAWLSPVRVVSAGLLCLMLLTLGLYLSQQKSTIDYVWYDDEEVYHRLFAHYAALEPHFYYDLLLDDDLTAEEIMYFNDDLNAGEIWPSHEEYLDNIASDFFIDILDVADGS